MMEAVRSLGLAARFVSGYLYDERLVASDEPVVGGGATHAWVEVYLPGAGWVEFDPTNGWVAGRNLIRVSVARTPQQAVPISRQLPRPARLLRQHGRQRGSRRRQRVKLLPPLGGGAGGRGGAVTSPSLGDNA